MINQFSLFTLTIIVFCFSWNLQAQFTDDFTDGNFSSNPTWLGDSAHFQVTPAFELNLNAPAITSVSQLLTPSSAIGNAVYNFKVRLDFDPSTSNYARVYLTSNDSNLSGNLEGYFVQIGGASGIVDDVSLYYQNGSTKTKIIDGVDGTVASSPEINIRVTRNMIGDWELLIDSTLNGSFVSQGTVFHNQTTTTSYFGVFCNYTSTRSDKFYFDDFVITGGLVVDVSPPVIDSIAVKSSTEIDVFFNEVVEQISAEEINHYIVGDGVGTPNSINLNAINKSIVHLVFGNQLVNNSTYNLSVTGVEDLAGNLINPQNISFSTQFSQEAYYGDVVINEIYADPTPTNGLPEIEFIELVNNTNMPVNLKNWKYSDASTTVTLPNFLLEGRNHLILCDEKDTALFTAFGKVLGLPSWPTLNNSTDNLGLRDAANNLIDTLDYYSSWYQDNDKSNGGWSLERKNPESICSDASNWSASNNLVGGTPGKVNSVFDTIILPFELISSSVLSLSTIEMVYSQKVDPSTVVTNNFTVSPHLSVIGAMVNGQNQNIIELAISPELEPEIIYQIIGSNLTDCVGNKLQPDSSVKVTLPQKQDLVINETLFNPRMGGSDFIELYNTTGNTIDLKNWSLLFYNNTGDSAYKIISSNTKIVQPEEFVVLTEDSANIKFEYPNSAEGVFIEMDLPTYSNAEGEVIILNQLGYLNDEFAYNESMHLELITDSKGVSLERANYAHGSNTKNNWHSASSTSGYATPGLENSQLVENNSVSHAVSLSPKTFSPNNDGYKDVLSIAYQFDHPNNVATVTIHNANGQLINTLVNNQTIGVSGQFFWDGTNNDGELMSTGMYVVMLRVFDLNNNQHVYKEVAVLAMP